NRQAIHAYLLGRTSDPAAAPDLMQETFLRAWRHLPELRGLTPDRQRAWLFTVARNIVIDTYRSRATRDATDAAVRMSASGTAPAYEEPAAQAELAEKVSELEAAIAELPEPQRVALTMSAVGGMTSAEIGTALGEPAGTIRYRLSQARR